MKKIIFLAFLISIGFITQSHIYSKKIAKILVFSKTMGFRHKASIATGKIALQQLGKEHNFEVDTIENANLFTERNLKKYAAIVFLNTTGDILDNKQQAAFERYIQAGGGFVGIHAATDTEYDWPWYGKLVGAYFLSHPKVQEAHFNIIDKHHSATAFFTDSTWIKKDELYNFKNINPDLKVLITIDEKSYEGGKNGGFHPFVWYHNYDGGRAFYTGMGHTSESWQENNFLNMLLGGIKYAIGDNKKLDYSKVETLPK